MHVTAEAISRAIKLLTAAQCQFAILTADGTKHGTLEIAEPEPKRTRQEPRFKRGTLKAYYEPILKTINPGSVNVVPFGPFDTDKASREALRSAIASECSRVWGNGSYITHMNERGIELLRMD